MAYERDHDVYENFNVTHGLEINFTTITRAICKVSQMAGREWPFQEPSPFYVEPAGPTRHETIVHIKGTPSHPVLPNGNYPYKVTCPPDDVSVVSQKSVTVP
jgi:hypothetical protein